VNAGDLLHADANGVTNIPLEIASEVASVAAEYVAAEAVILDYVKAGAPDPERFPQVRQEFVRRIAELGEQVLGRARA
jgi:regulator of RNase E activity RraA